MGIEREDSINSFSHISQEEVNLVKACCRLLEGLDHIAEADRLKELVGRMNKWVRSLGDRLTTRELYIEDLEEEIWELREELEGKVRRIGELEEEGNQIAHRELVRETGIVKVAINTIYGGFGLSRAAQLKYKDLTGKYIDIYNIPRDDKALIQVIEELGKFASASYSSLSIVEVPIDTNWDILEYDGLEMVIDTDRVWRG